MDEQTKDLISKLLARLVECTALLT